MGLCQDEDRKNFSLRRPARIQTEHRVIDEAARQPGLLATRHYRVSRIVSVSPVCYSSFVPPLACYLDKDTWPTLPEEKRRHWHTRTLERYRAFVSLLHVMEPPKAFSLSVSLP